MDEETERNDGNGNDLQAGAAAIAPVDSNMDETNGGIDPSKVIRSNRNYTTWGVTIAGVLGLSIASYFGLPKAIEWNNVRIADNVATDVRKDVTAEVENRFSGHISQADYELELTARNKALRDTVALAYSQGRNEGFQSGKSMGIFNPGLSYASETYDEGFRLFISENSTEVPDSSGFRELMKLFSPMRESASRNDGDVMTLDQFVLQVGELRPNSLNVRSIDEATLREDYLTLEEDAAPYVEALNQGKEVVVVDFGFGDKAKNGVSYTIFVSDITLINEQLLGGI